MSCSLLALSAPTRYNEEPLQQHDTLLNYSRVVASGRERGEATSFATVYAHRRAGRVLGRAARNSFSLVRPPVPPPVPRHDQFSRSRGESNSCSHFDMSLALPAHFGSIPRLSTRSFIRGSFSFFLPFSRSFLLRLSTAEWFTCVFTCVRHVSSPFRDPILSSSEMASIAHYTHDRSIENWRVIVTSTKCGNYIFRIFKRKNNSAITFVPSWYPSDIWILR